MLGLVRRKLTNMHGHFRSSVWDPVLIIAQIICMQCVYYTSAGFWLYFTSYVGNFDRRLSQIFTQSVSIDIYQYSLIINPCQQEESSTFTTIIFAY